MTLILKTFVCETSMIRLFWTPTTAGLDVALYSKQNASGYHVRYGHMVIECARWKSGSEATCSCQSPVLLTAVHSKSTTAARSRPTPPSRRARKSHEQIDQGRKTNQNKVKLHLGLQKIQNMNILNNYYLVVELNIKLYPLISDALFIYIPWHPLARDLWTRMIFGSAKQHLKHQCSTPYIFGRWSVFGLHFCCFSSTDMKTPW